MDERATQCQLLLHAARKCPRFALPKGFNLRVNACYRGIILFNGRTEKGGKKVQIFFNGEVLVERKPAGHIPHPTANILHLRHHIETIHAQCPGIGHQ